MSFFYCHISYVKQVHLLLYPGLFGKQTQEGDLQITDVNLWIHSADGKIRNSRVSNLGFLTEMSNKILPNLVKFSL